MSTLLEDPQTSQEQEAVRSESHLRSILKATTWRIVASLTTMTIAYIVFRDLTKVFQVGVFEFFLKFFIYYAHERAWQSVPRGTIRSVFQSKSK